MNETINKINKLHSENRVWLHQGIPFAQPKAIFLEPTTFCNFKCCYCTHSNGKDLFESQVRPYQKMSQEVRDRIVSEISQFQAPLNMVEFSGMGEPLIHPELPEFIAKIKATGKSGHTRLITNASLLTELICHKLVDAHVDSIRVSLQGISKETYEKTCGVAIDFDKLVAQLKYFHQHKGNTQLFLKNINIALSEEEKTKFYELFQDHCDRLYVETIIPFFSQVDYGFLSQTNQKNRYQADKIHLDVCPNTFTSLVINVEGDISMCGKEVGPCYLGNVKHTSLMDAWNSEKRTDFLRLQLNKRRFENPICKDCQIPTESLASEKDILDPYADEILQKLT